MQTDSCSSPKNDVIYIFNQSNKKLQQYNNKYGGQRDAISGVRTSIPSLVMGVNSRMPARKG